MHLLNVNGMVKRMCELFAKWKIKFQQEDVPEHCAYIQTTVVLRDFSIMDRQGLKVKVQLSIEPSVGGGERWACRQPIEQSESLTAKARAVVCRHIWWKGFYCVHAKLRWHKQHKS